VGGGRVIRRRGTRLKHPKVKRRGASWWNVFSTNWLFGRSRIHKVQGRKGWWAV